MIRPTVGLLRVNSRRAHRRLFALGRPGGKIPA